MINLLAAGLISVCLLSPVQSPDCAGGIGVSVPTPHIQLPAPLPALPALPALTLPNLPAPAPVPVPVPVVPAPRPVAPAPVVAPPAALPAAPAPIDAPAPAPAPVVVPESPTQPETPTTAAVPTTPPAEVITPPTQDPDPAAHDTLESVKPTGPPFAGDSVPAMIGNTALQFPDIALFLLALAALGIILLNEKVDTSFKNKRVPRHSTKPVSTDFE